MAIIQLGIRLRIGLVVGLLFLTQTGWAQSSARLKLDDSSAATTGSSNQGNTTVKPTLPRPDTNTATIKFDAAAPLPPSKPPTATNADSEFVRIGYWQSGGVVRPDHPTSSKGATENESTDKTASDPDLNGPDESKPAVKKPLGSEATPTVPQRDAATAGSQESASGAASKADSIPARTESILVGTPAANSATSAPAATAAAAANLQQDKVRLLLSDESMKRMKSSGNSFQLQDQAPPPPPRGVNDPDPNFRFLGASYLKRQDPETISTPAPLGTIDREQNSDGQLSASGLVGSEPAWAQLQTGFESKGAACNEDPFPLYYSTLWVGHSDLDTLRDDHWDSTQFNGAYHTATGVSAGIGLGMYHGRRLRSEFELAVRANSLDYFEITRPVALPFQTEYPLDGNLRTYSGMSNVYWDFWRGTNRRLQPYLGLGIGFAFHDADFDNFGQTVLIENFDRDSSFAYQWMVGVNAVVSQDWDLFVEYRFFGTDGLRLGTQFSQFGPHLGDPAQVFGDYDYRSQNVLMGVRLKF